MSVLRFSQVLAACVYPPLINSSNLPLDVRQRAQEELGRCVGGSVGEGNVCGLMTWKKMKMLVVQDPQGGAHKLTAHSYPSTEFLLCDNYYCGFGPWLRTQAPRLAATPSQLAFTDKKQTHSQLMHLRTYSPHLSTAP